MAALIALTLVVVLSPAVVIPIALFQVNETHPHSRPGWAIAPSFPFPVSRERFASTPPARLAAIYGIREPRDIVWDSELSAGASALSRPSLFGDRFPVFFVGPSRLLHGVCATGTERIEFEDAFIFPIGWRLVRRWTAPRAVEGERLGIPIGPVGSPGPAGPCASLGPLHFVWSLDHESDAEVERQAAIIHRLLGPPGERVTDFRVDNDGGCTVDGQPCAGSNFFKHIDARWVTQVGALSLIAPPAIGPLNSVKDQLCTVGPPEHPDLNQALCVRVISTPPVGGAKPKILAVVF
ncbi:MAG TPA: hypothetical protein VGI95_07015 [Caulobacteraceae bacterium]|jgi:hypothetical protein